jgi:hypothetical protein
MIAGGLLLAIFLTVLDIDLGVASLRTLQKPDGYSQ